MRALLITLIVAAMVVGGLAGAVEGPGFPPCRLREQWRNLSPDERAAVKERYERFKSLPVEERERLRLRYRKFEKLNPDKRRAMRDRWQLFRSLAPEERRCMIKMHKHWQRMPAEHREKIRKRMQMRFRRMPDDRLAEFFRNLSIWRMLPPEEQKEAFQRFIEIRKRNHGQLGTHPGGPHNRAPGRKAR